jgi:hypothetical protein
MKNRNTMLSRFSRFSPCALAGVLVFALNSVANAQSAYVRVSEVGYETHNAPFQAYLMSTASGSGATFSVFSTSATLWARLLSKFAFTSNETRCLAVLRVFGGNKKG